MRDRLLLLVACVAVLVGGLSFAGGVMANNAADHKVCEVTVQGNQRIRRFLDDVIVTNPHVTRAERKSLDSLALTDFPDHC